MLPLQQTVACISHHLNLFECLNKMCSSYLLMSTWDLRCYALDLNGFVLNLSCFWKTHKSKNKIVRALIIILALIFLSGMAIEKRVEAHIIVSKYWFPYLASGSGSTQSTITLLKDYSKEGTDRSGATRMLWIGFTITPQMLQYQQLSATSRLIFGK
jgi:hypothetical protein